jgi:beta-glucanase (GH16 family)
MWAEDFNGPAGSPPDPSIWTAILDGNGGGNRELQYYVPQAVALNGHGNMQIAAARDNGSYPAWYGPSQFTSAKVWTQDKLEFAYGRLAVRAALPAGLPGSWPAIWLLGADIGEVGWPACGEIDLVESFGKDADPAEISAAIHTPADNIHSRYCLPPADNARRPHTYALDWRPQSLTFSVDGHDYLTIRKKQVQDWLFDRPFFLIINLAIGGTMGGNIPSTAPLPYTMSVDYVRLQGVGTVLKG